VCLNGAMTDTAIKTKPTARTYLDVPATTWEYARTKSAIRSGGNRIHATRWLADGTGGNSQYKAGDLHLTHVQGDARKGTLVVFHDLVIPKGTDAQADAAAEAWLGVSV